MYVCMYICIYIYIYVYSTTLHKLNIGSVVSVTCKVC